MKKPLFIQLVQLVIVLALFKFCNCDLSHLNSINHILNQHFTNVNACRSINVCSLRIVNFNTKAEIFLNNSIHLVKYDIEFLSFKESSLVFQINSIQFKPQIDLNREYLPSECGINENVTKCEFKVNKSVLRSKRTIENLDILKFTKNIYTFKALEKQSTGRVLVGKLQINNENLLTFNNLIVSMKATRDFSSENLFQIDAKTLEIYTKQILDTSVMSNVHYFRVFIRQKHEHSPFTSCSIIVNVVNGEVNTPPKFKFNSYEAQVFENNAPDTLLIRVEATDDDYGENARITYHLAASKIFNENSDDDTNTMSNPFHIKSDTGEIYARRILNREQKDFYVLNVLAIDNGPYQRLNSSTQVFVRVLAQRDNAPKFERPFYNLTLSENADFLQRPVVMTVRALESSSLITNQTDFSLDNTNNLIYSLHGSLNDLNTFEIDSKTGEIRLVSKLNYELKNVYQLSVIARDFGQPPCSTHSILTINIEDMNQNPPVFTAPFYEFILFENVPLGFSVGRVYAFDRENSKMQENNSNIKYSIVNNGQEQSGQTSFEIDAANGTIYTVRKLNRKNSNNFEFYVMALDMRRNSLNLNLNSSVKVKIKILDINDNVPEFSKPYYTLNISEEAAPVGLPLLTLTVKNKDLTSQLEYSIESGNENEMFTLIKPENNRVFFTLKRSSLNYKKKSNYNLEIKVMDSYGLYSIANLNVNILPSKNLSPRFTKDTYSFKIKESSPVGSLVGVISASFYQAEIDTGSIVSYKIIVNTETDRTSTLSNTVDFRLDEQTGQLFVSNLLDREKYSSVTLYVTASDQSKPFRADHALIQIEILDVNDNKPIFTRQFYEVDVYENIKTNSYLLRVEANDKDLGDNGIVRYTIDDESGKSIRIDEKTGIIRLNKSPTFSFLNISLTASDMGQPSLSSKTFILIRNIFSNDSPPYFDRNPLIFYLVENQPVGTILGELKARDIDNDYFNSNIVYKILDKNGNDFFELKQLGRFNTVLLATKFVADYEHTDKTFTFQVRAYSFYSFSDCSINVIVRSLNENPPLVKSPFKIIFNNYKNFFLTEQTARVPIQNTDPTNNLTFKLVDSVGKQLVNLNSKTGQITLKSILNSNNQINASFQISVHDGVHEVRATCNLVVLMLSSNLIDESVTLNFYNVEVDTFLSYLYDNFTNTILDIIPPIVSSVKQSNIHIFGITNITSGINLSLAVSYDYEKDIFMPASVLKQIVYSNMGLIKSNLKIHKILIYQDTSCSIEPCLNFQKCSTNVKFLDASPSYTESGFIQFRSIDVKHDFSCSCPMGFTGKNVSLMCDLEINLCYSNPCGQNGICVSLESGFRCICDPDFTGRMCEYNMKSTTCCELAEVPKTRSLEVKNKTRITINNCVTAKPSIYDFYSIELSNNRVCKGDSVCKNLILGGVLCDKCGTSLRENETKVSYYNKFCELRARHFPENSNSFIVFEGIRNRLRFKIKLSFATIKSNSFLFYNGLLETNSKIKGHDFVQLEIRNDYLVFSYSLGDVLVNELILDSLSVSDGKWRTATIEYIDRNVTLSVDDDDLDHVDACSFARNKESFGSLECFRVNAFYNLPKKCENQIETCFRYFDLNGPFNLGRGSVEGDSYYEGCISDLYLDDQLVNLDEDALLNHKTEIGCEPKVNKCKDDTDVKCSNCKHLWSDKLICNANDKKDSETFSLASNGYLVMEKNKVKTTDDIVIEFSVKLSLYTQSNKPMKLMRLESENFKLDLNYESDKHVLSLKNMTNAALIQITKNHLLKTSYWNKIEIKFSPKNNSIYLIVNDLFVSNGSFSSQNEIYSSWFMGGDPTNLENNFSGCFRDIKRNGEFMKPLEKINVSKGCPSGKINSDKVKVCGTNSPCYNNGTCTVDASSGNIECTCPAGFKGEFCQYKNKVTMKIFEKACPAKWWGKESGICGPCECDETKNFSPDCDKSTGECQCKSKYYKTKEDRCVPCDCYLEGSTSLQCEPLTGQCPCLKGAGITGRRCDQCVAPLAEMTSKGSECRQLNSNECPRALGSNIWWPRTPFNAKANSSCPKGSKGVAFRTCVENVGWLNDVDVSGCSSIKLVETQLLKWSKELNANKSQLNSYQAFKLVEELNKLTTDADLDENNANDLDSQVFIDSTMKNGHLSTSLNALYAIDFIIIKNLTQKILQYEIDNAPEFLYIQDKYFLTNIFSILNVVLSKNHEIKFHQLKKSELSTSTNFTQYSSLTEILIKLDTYLKLITDNLQGYSLNENGVQINFPNVQMFMKTIQGQSFSEATQNVKFKLLESSAETTSINSNFISHKLAYVSLNGPSFNFPNELVTALYNTKSKKLIQPVKYSNFLVASNVFMLNSVSIMPYPTHNSTTTKSTETNSQSAKSFYIIIDFDLTNNYESLYDSTTNIISYLDIKVSKADYKCVYLNKELKAWSTYGAKLIAFDPQANTVKCSYDHFSIYAVITPSGNFMRNSINNPVNFDLTFYVIMPFIFFFLALTILCLCFLRRYKTPLTVIYINLCLNVFFLHLIFFLGINGNSSPITCKFVSILQHYFHLSSYLWLFIISLHLYRMLTELRDINKIGTCSPVFYYVIAYVTPTLIVSLTLGIKQDIYTNYDNISSHQYYASSIYCWFNLNNTNELFIVFLLPLAVICLTFLVLCLMSFKERKQSTFKQTDLGLVYHSLLSSLLLLPFKCLITVFLVKFLIDQINSTGGSDIYEYLYLCFTLVYSILMFLLFVLLNKFTKKNMLKAWLSLKNSSSLLNESLNASKSKLTNEFNNFTNKSQKNQQPQPTKSALLIKSENNNNNLYQINIDKNPSQFVLDYHDFQNHTQSISTTTTSGTMENVNTINNTTDDINSQDSIDYLKSNGYGGMGNFSQSATTNNTSNGYLSHLANTTNTESTTNEESEFNYDFNRPHLMQQIYKNENIRECDVVDVEKILKSRNAGQNYHQQQQQQQTEQFKYAVNQMMMMENTPSKYYNEKFNEVGVKTVTPSQVNLQHSNNNHQQQQPQAALFWPTTIAECDTSFLEGSIVYTPTKLPFKTNTMPTDLLTCSTNSNNLQHQPNYLPQSQLKNNSYNSNGSSGTTSNSQQSNANNVFTTSNSSLLLNGDGTNGIFETCATTQGLYQQPNLMQPNFNYINNNHNQQNNICPIFTHTGSPNSSDNDSNNETRV